LLILSETGSEADARLLNKETRNAGERLVHGFMGSLLNPKSVSIREIRVKNLCALASWWLNLRP
jgi:hypothetical protein